MFNLNEKLADPTRNTTSNLTTFERSTFDNSYLSTVETEASERTKDYVRASSSDATLKAYKSDLEHFVTWGGEIPASVQLIANYLSDHAGILSVSTLSRRIAAISKIHKVRQFEDPTKSELVRSTMRGIKRQHHTAQKQVAPITKERLLKMVGTCGDHTRDSRDRALLLIGFASALRRSELVAINCKDVEFVPEGLILNIKRSKTDQLGEGRRIGIPYANGDCCPVRSLKTYMDDNQLIQGSLFRSMDDFGLSDARLTGHGVAYIIKQRAKLADFDPTMFSGHSLRAGFATTAAQAGVETWAIMRQTGHKSETTLRRYIRDGELFTVNAMSNIL